MTLFADQWNFEAFGMSLLAAGIFGAMGIALLALGFAFFLVLRSPLLALIPTAFAFLGQRLVGVLDIRCGFAQLGDFLMNGGSLRRFLGRVLRQRLAGCSLMGLLTASSARALGS